MLFTAFLFFILTPFLFEGWVIESTNDPRFFVASFLLFIAIVFLIFGKNNFQIPSKFLFLLLSLFYVLNLLGLFWALNTADLIFESQKVIIGIFALLFFYNYVQTDENENSVIQAIVVSFLVVLIITV